MKNDHGLEVLFAIGGFCVGTIFSSFLYWNEAKNARKSTHEYYQSHAVPKRDLVDITHREIHEVNYTDTYRLVIQKPNPEFCNWNMTLFEGEITYKLSGNSLHNVKDFPYDTLTVKKKDEESVTINLPLNNNAERGLVDKLKEVYASKNSQGVNNAK